MHKILLENLSTVIYFYKSDANSNFSMFDLPYKLIFAVATIDMVLVYST
jgi:hypothetical protein